MGDPDSRQKVDITVRLNQVHLRHNSTDFTGQRSQNFNGAVRETGRVNRGGWS